MAVGQKSNSTKYFEIRKIGNDAFVASYLGNSTKPEDIRQGFGELKKVSKDGVDRFYDTFGFVSGKITNLFIRKEEINGTEISVMNVNLDDNGEKYSLKLGDLYGSYTRQFFQRILSPEVSVDSEVLVEPYKWVKADKSIGTALSIKVDGKNIAIKDVDKNILSFLAGMPEGKPVTVQGKPMTDYTDQVVWLMKQVKAKYPAEVFNKLEGSNYSSSTSGTSGTTSADNSNQHTNVNTQAQAQPVITSPDASQQVANPAGSIPGTSSNPVNTVAQAPANTQDDQAPDDDDLPF